MKQDAGKVLTYAPPAPAAGDIVYEYFADGGVTVTVPPPPPKRSARGNAASVAAALTFLIAVLSAAGAPPWELVPVLVRVLPKGGWLPVGITMGFVGVAVAMLAVIDIRRPTRPAVVGISPVSLHVNVPGIFFTRNFTVPRRQLLGVDIVRWDRTVARRPRCVRVRVMGKAPVVFAEHRMPEEVMQLADVLARATAAGAD